MANHDQLSANADNSELYASEFIDWSLCGDRFALESGRQESLAVATDSVGGDPVTGHLEDLLAIIVDISSPVTRLRVAEQLRRTIQTISSWKWDGMIEAHLQTIDSLPVALGQPSQNPNVDSDDHNRPFTRQAIEAVPPTMMQNQTAVPVMLGDVASDNYIDALFPKINQLLKLDAPRHSPRVINYLNDDYNDINIPFISSGATYQYRMEDSMRGFLNWTNVLESSFPGFSNGYAGEPHHTVCLYPSGKSISIPFGKPIRLPDAPNLPQELKAARRMEPNDIKAVLKASGKWLCACTTMKAYTESQVLRNPWYIPRQVRFYVACVNLFVSFLGLMPPDTPSDIDSHAVLLYQPEIYLPEEGAPDRCFVTGFKEKGPAALIEYFIGYEHFLRNAVMRNMIGIVEDGLKGPNPRYGTRQELKAAVRSDRVHQYRPITLQLSAESQGSPPVFSGLLIWDFLICIGLSEPWNILKHYSVNKDGNEPFSLPDETLTSAAFVSEYAAKTVLGLFQGPPLIADMIQRQRKLERQVVDYRSHREVEYTNFVKALFGEAVRGRE